MRHGGAPVDVAAPKAKPPAPEAPAPEAEQFAEERAAAFKEFKQKLNEDAVVQLADPNIETFEYGKKFKKYEKNKWEDWNEWAQVLLTKRGVPRMRNFDLKTVQPITRDALLKYTSDKILEATRVHPAHPAKQKRAPAKASPEETVNAIANLRNKIYGLIFSDDRGTPKTLRKLTKRSRAGVYESDRPRLEEMLKKMDEFLGNTRDAEEASEFAGSIVGTPEQINYFKKHLGIDVSALIRVIGGVPGMTGGWGTLEDRRTGELTFRVPKTRATTVQSDFKKRFNKTLTKFGTEDEKKEFFRAFDGWMENATGAKGFIPKKYEKEHGRSALVAMAKAFAKLQDGVGPVESMQSEELVREIMKSKRLEKLVTDAGLANPGSMRRLMTPHEAARSVVGVRVELRRLRNHRMAIRSPVSRDVPDAEDVPGAGAELLAAGPKKGRPKNAEATSPYAQWFKHDIDEDGELTEAHALSTLRSVLTGDHAKHKSKFGRHAADLNRYYRAVEYLTGTGGRTDRVVNFEGPLHYGNYHGRGAGSVHKYPREVDDNQNIFSLMQSLTQQFQIPGVRSKANETVSNTKAHEKTEDERAALLKALEQKQTIEIPITGASLLYKAESILTRSMHSGAR